MSNNYNDVIKIRKLIEALHMFALYDISVKELNKLIKLSDNVEDLAHNIICYGDEDE
jgi:hypothetical protein